MFTAETPPCFGWQIQESQFRLVHLTGPGPARGPGPTRRAAREQEARAHGFDGETPDQALAGMRPALHPGHLTYAEHALRTYVGACAGDGEQRLRPVRPYWVARRENGKCCEMYAWWRSTSRPTDDCASTDGCGTARPRTPSPARSPSPCTWPFAGARRPGRGSGAARSSRLHPPPGPSGCVSSKSGSPADGPQVQFDGTAEEAEAYYAEHGHGHGHAHVARVVAGGRPAPGSSCVDCKQGGRYAAQRARLSGASGSGTGAALGGADGRAGRAGVRRRSPSSGLEPCLNRVRSSEALASLRDLWVASRV